MDLNSGLRPAAETAAGLDELTSLYFRHVPAAEIVGDGTVISGVVRAHRRLAASRVPGRPAIQVLNPCRDSDGWDCPVTAVLITVDDMPYLVDSVVAALARSEVTVYRMVHPLLVVRRSVTGELLSILTEANPADPPPDALVESWIYLEVSRVTDADTARRIEQMLKSVLDDVREVVEDSAKMAATARLIATELAANPPASLTAQEVRDGADFLRWLADGHFTFLGYRRYELVRPGGEQEPALRAVLASGLGILRKDSLATRGFAAGQGLELALSKELLMLTRASAESTVARPAHPYNVGVKTFDADGEVGGEHRFLGMLTSAVVYDNVLDIPVIRGRVLDALARASAPLESYYGQRMLEVIQEYPRAELFATDAQTLCETVTAVLSSTRHRRKLRLFLRRDPYHRFYAVLVYLPRDRWITATRLRIQDVLVRELEGHRIDYSVRVSEAPLARAYFVVHTDPVATAGQHPDVAAIQDLVTAAVRTWEDRLADSVAATDPELSDQTNALAQRYLDGIPESYKEAYDGAEALADLSRLEALADAGEPNQLDMSFYTPVDAEPGELRFKLYLIGGGIILSRMLPVLQAMGVTVIDERPYRFTRDDGALFSIYDFGLRADPAVLDGVPEAEREAASRRFQQTFAVALACAAEVDKCNALVLRAGLDWREAALLRAYARYLQQAGTIYSQDYIEDVLLAHPPIAAALVHLFQARFNPNLDDAERAQRAARLSAELSSMINAVAGLDADRILRSYLTLITATLRTNYYLPSAEHAPLAFKLDPQAIRDLPTPRPRSEIFVYSPQFEGVHLRFGPVARGGLRWSDRREDFRTEILALAREQTVKNAAIVPTGAQGAFVLKYPPQSTGDPDRDRETLLAEGIDCYRTFIGALLNLTDNLIDGVIVPAPHVVRHDGDDPYLVIAAGKGTATFLDIANEVAASRGFWLGDAFATGGSTGYNHRATDVTARDAWESAEGHLRELGIDTRADDFTVAGIGDMSADVFGSGVLLSTHIRLVAAFDHRHILIDPDPDPAVSFEERQRLFHLPQSSWDDYDRAKISTGGGVWPRTAESIPISAATRAALGLAGRVAELSPAELVRAILLSPVDLLWNGGTGTYVKASTETHADVGDRDNDAIRVDGNELRAKAVGEGGDLGLTQRGRVEFARAGGKVNTDAIDNSAGADFSDREVNVKILLDRLVAARRFSARQRDRLLAETADEVAGLVLASSRRRNAALVADRATARQYLPLHARIVSTMESSDGLDRDAEVLPTDIQFAAMEMAREALTAPQLARLAARAKIALTARIMTDGIPGDAKFVRRLIDYFPASLGRRYGADVTAHPLSSNIVAVSLANEMADIAGPVYAYQLGEEMNTTLPDIIRTYEVTATLFDIPRTWAAVHELGAATDPEAIATMLLTIRGLVLKASRWLLTHRSQPFDSHVESRRYDGVLPNLIPHVTGWLQGADAARSAAMSEGLVAADVPAELADRIGAAAHSVRLLDVSEIVSDTAPGGPEVGFVARLYYALVPHLGIGPLLESLHARGHAGAWHDTATHLIEDQLYRTVRGVTQDILTDCTSDDPQVAIDQWASRHSHLIRQAQRIAEAASHSDATDLSVYFIAANAFASLADPR